MTTCLPWATTPAGCPDSRWRTPWGTALPIVSFAIVVTVYTFLEPLGPHLWEIRPAFLTPLFFIWNDAVLASSYIVALILVWPWVSVRHGWFVRDPTPLATRLQMAMGAFPIGLAIGASVFLIAWHLSDGHFGETGMKDSHWGDPAVLLLGTAYMTLIVPLGEEGLFRVLLYGLLRRRFSARVAIPVTSVLFAACHGIDWPAPSGLALGLIASAVYERTRSFAFCFAIHAGVNLAFIVLRILFHRHGDLL